MTAIIASNTIQYSDAALSGTTSVYPTMALMKTITMTNSYTGSWRISFRMGGGFDGTYYYTGYGQIYKNGVPYGTLQSVIGTQTFNQDFSNISISAGDNMQIYAAMEPGSDVATILNFYIEFDVAVNKSSMFTMF